MMLDAIDVAARLRKACQEAGSQKAFAEQHGISPGYLCDVLSARVAPGQPILDALGLRKVTRYVETRMPNAASREEAMQRVADDAQDQMAAGAA